MSSKKQTSTRNTRTKAERTPNERLRAQRLKKNWTQVYVATRIGTSDIEVSRWETGVTMPTMYFREQLCALFGAPPETLGFVLSQEIEQEKSAQANEFWNVPYRRNPFFTGREDALTRIAALFDNEKRAKMAQAVAISGLGGVGKTQVAVEYAYRHYDEYQAIFWVRADAQENLGSDIATLAYLLDLPQKNERNQEKAIQLVKRWLQAHHSWLLILDNVEDLMPVNEWLGVETGHILLTTRSQFTGTLAQAVPLERMVIEESITFLLHRSKLLPSSTTLEEAPELLRSSASILVEALDGLPLALDQAGAYIEETGCNLSTYLERFHHQRATLLARRGQLGADHPHSVMTTITLTCVRVEQINPAALDLLRLCAFLHADAIPEELITQGAAHLGPVLQPVASDLCKLDEAISTLRAYSLIRRDPCGKTLSVHRLVQAVLKERTDTTEQRRWAEKVVSMLMAAVPPIDDVTGSTEWERGKRYLAQIFAGVSLIDLWKLQSSESECIFHWIGSYSIALGQYARAESFLLRALEISRAIGETEQPFTAAHMNDLAVVYINKGKYDQAELLLQNALTIRINTLGSECLEVAESLCNLGALYNSQDRYSQAAPLLEQALHIQEKVLGPNHLNTALSLNNLGFLYIQLGHYTQAEPLLQRALNIREQALGSEHPNVAFCLKNLGIVYREQGQLVQAEQLLLLALKVREEAFGPDHPQVAQSLHELAVLYTRQGRFDEAALSFQRALTIRERELGKEHPDTLATSNAYTDLLKKMHAIPKVV